MNIPLKCKCGALRGLANDVSPTTGKRIICLCDDCQAYAYYLGRPEILDANGGTDVIPVAPARLVFGKIEREALRAGGKSAV